MRCVNCDEKWSFYMVVALARNGGSKQFIDAEWLAFRMKKTGHVVAMANRRAAWLTTPLLLMHTDEEMLNMFIKMVVVDDSLDDDIQDMERSHTGVGIIHALVTGWYGEQYCKELLTNKYNRSVLDE